MRRKWSKDDILYAMLEWEEKNGEPPKWNDWMIAGEDHPVSMTVRKHFGSWNNAMAAAGFTPRDPHANVPPSGIPPKMTPEIKKKANHLRRQGIPDYAIAERLGISRSTIQRHLGHRPKPKPVLIKRTREQRIADLRRALAKEE